MTILSASHNHTAAKDGTGSRTTNVIDRNAIQHVFDSDEYGHVTSERIATIGLRPGDPPFFVTEHDYNADATGPLFPEQRARGGLSNGKRASADDGELQARRRPLPDVRQLALSASPRLASD